MKYGISHRRAPFFAKASQGRQREEGPFTSFLYSDFVFLACPPKPWRRRVNFVVNLLSLACPGVFVKPGCGFPRWALRGESSLHCHTCYSQ